MALKIGTEDHPAVIGGDMHVGFQFIIVMVFHVDKPFDFEMIPIVGKLVYPLVFR
jgi:hypothetical protein